MNENDSFKVVVDAKVVRDRYEILQGQFNKKDKKHAMMSGIGDEVSEADELLSKKYESREEMTLQRDRNRLVVRELEQRKLQAETRVTERALDSRVLASEDEGSKSDNESDALHGSVVGENVREKRKKRRVVNYGAQFRGEMDRLVQFSRRAIRRNGGWRRGSWL